MADAPYLLISSDCHAGAPPDVYATYLDPGIRETYAAWLDGQAAPPPAPTAGRTDDTITSQIAGIALDPFGPGIRERFFTSEAVTRGAVQGSWEPSRRDAELDAAGV